MPRERIFSFLKFFWKGGWKSSGLALEKLLTFCWRINNFSDFMFINRFEFLVQESHKLSWNVSMPKNEGEILINILKRIAAAGWAEDL